MAFTIQPLLFRFAISDKAKKGLAPMRLRTSVHGFFLFAYYGLGGMFLSVLSVTIFPLIPVAKRKKLRVMHKILSKMVTSVLYGNPFVKKEIRNPHQETFDKPSIIISNHASALDTLVLGMVTPKLIYLVNDWVYKSPIFGLIARVAGFYPVSSGVDNSHAHLKEKLEQGYSLVVFPEGKRSFTNKIGRFHKGAFFLAEELELDILPIYLHGNSEVLPKGDRVIYDGSLTAKIGKRIPITDTTFGENYKERQKKLSAFYKAEFQKLRDDIEDADYFKDILLSNYIYKGDDFYQSIKQDFKERKHLYQAISTYIPFKCKMLHIADDYGQIDVLLVARSLDRRITTWIKEEEKRAIAANCYKSMVRKVTYPESILKYGNCINQQTNILLISKPLEELPEVLVSHFDKLKTIVLVKNENLITQLEKYGFMVKKKENNLTVLEIK
jgi:1-acyl-sn-glycerol-3-phosphate acyltransferase